MNRWLKLIWFNEDPWTKVHAAIGIKAEKTLCGIARSTRQILASEKCKSNMRSKKCANCLAILRRDFGTEDITEVKVE